MFDFFGHNKRKARRDNRLDKRTGEALTSTAATVNDSLIQTQALAASTVQACILRLPKTLMDKGNELLTLHAKVSAKKSLLDAEDQYLLGQIPAVYLPEVLDNFIETLDSGTANTIIDGTYTAAQICEQNIMLITQKLESMLAAQNAVKNDDITTQRKFLMDRLASGEMPVPTAQNNLEQEIADRLAQQEISVDTQSEHIRALENLLKEATGEIAAIRILMNKCELTLKQAQNAGNKRLCKKAYEQHQEIRHAATRLIEKRAVIQRQYDMAVAAENKKLALQGEASRSLNPSETVALEKTIQHERAWIEQDKAGGENTERKRKHLAFHGEWLNDAIAAKQAQIESQKKIVSNDHKALNKAIALRDLIEAQGKEIAEQEKWILVVEEKRTSTDIDIRPSVCEFYDQKLQTLYTLLDKLKAKQETDKTQHAQLIVEAETAKTAALISQANNPSTVHYDENGHKIGEVWCHEIKQWVEYPNDLIDRNNPTCDYCGNEAQTVNGSCSPCFQDRKKTTTKTITVTALDPRFGAKEITLDAGSRLMDLSRKIHMSGCNNLPALDQNGEKMQPTDILIDGMSIAYQYTATVTR